VTPYVCTHTPARPTICISSFISQEHLSEVTPWFCWNDGTVSSCFRVVLLKFTTWKRSSWHVLYPPGSERIPYIRQTGFFLFNAPNKSLMRHSRATRTNSPLAALATQITSTTSPRVNIATWSLFFYGQNLRKDSRIYVAVENSRTNLKLHLCLHPV
jgi:hypothetical protein